MSLQTCSNNIVYVTTLLGIQHVFTDVKLWLDDFPAPEVFLLSIVMQLFPSYAHQARARRFWILDFRNPSEIRHQQTSNTTDLPGFMCKRFITPTAEHNSMMSNRTDSTRFASHYSSNQLMQHD